MAPAPTFPAVRVNCEAGQTEGDELERVGFKSIRNTVIVVEPWQPLLNAETLYNALNVGVTVGVCGLTLTVELKVPITVLEVPALFQYLKVYREPPVAVSVKLVPGQIEGEEGVSVGVMLSIPIEMVAVPGQLK